MRAISTVKLCNVSLLLFRESQPVLLYRQYFCSFSFFAAYLSDQRNKQNERVLV